jgi:hypothetical protein
MSGVSWFSASKGGEVEIATMSGPQARNCLGKLNRGEATGPDGEKLPFGAEQVVRDALEQRILDLDAQRELDSQAKAEAQGGAL